MSSLSLDRHLLVPRPGRLLARMSIGVLLPSVVVIVTMARTGGSVVGLFGGMFILAQVAAAVATAHKEILASTISFFQPGLRRRVLRAQLAWAGLGAGVVTGLLGTLYSDFGPAALAGIFGIGLLVHGLVSLAMLWLSWGYQLQVWMLYLLVFSKPLGRLARSGQLDVALSLSWLWLGAAAVVLVLLGRALVSTRLHRRVCGTMVLGVDDLFRAGRLEEYKQRRAQRGRAAGGPAWRARALAALTARADAAKRRGSPVAARAWQLMAADFAANVSTRPLVVPVLFLALLTLMLWFGYANMGDEDGFFTQVWFGGLVFQWALFPLFSLAQVLLTPPRTDVSRRSGLRAELAALGGTALVSCALALATAGVFQILEAVLPPLPWRGETLTFRPGAPHGIWLVPLVAPFTWLAIALRPRPQCSLTNAAIMFPYFGGHFLLTAVPYAQSTPIVLAASLAAFATAFLLRRRWWSRADLGL